MGERKLYATYIEMTRVLGADRQRKQWVVLPPLPQAVAPEGFSPSNAFLYFQRTQRDATHRAIWNSYRDHTHSFVADLKARLAKLEGQGWNLSPIVTCEVHPLELAELVANPKTPYRILQRLSRVARVKHGYTI